jgi:prepilin-type N-terminal cleavage/methylation domain-containing protein
MHGTKTRNRREQGFTLIEMLAAVCLMVIVVGVAVKGMQDLQTRNFAESSKVDTVQETRDFIDQMVRDIHGVGYPPPAVVTANGVAASSCSDGLGTATSIRNNVSVACGIVSWSPTSMVYEGDLDGSGTVSAVFMKIVTPTGLTTCPCTLQRGVESKADELLGKTPTYFTEVNGVLNSGDGTGAATHSLSSLFSTNYNSYTTADVFEAYDANGDRLSDSAGVDVTSCGVATPSLSITGTNPDCAAIKSVQITANVVPSYQDPTTKVYPVFSITSKAKLNN